MTKQETKKLRDILPLLKTDKQFALWRILIAKKKGALL